MKLWLRGSPPLNKRCCGGHGTGMTKQRHVIASESDECGNLLKQLAHERDCRGRAFAKAVPRHFVGLIPRNDMVAVLMI